ncbi:MAG: serine hydrolase domain-containing protein [Saprospiraceae bacterium]
MKRVSNLIFLFILLSTQAASGQGQLENLADSLFAEYKLHTPGAAVAIVKDGKVVLQKGYGSANLEYKVPIQSNTVFHIASLSKQFTAYAIYLLAREGKISLEDEVRTYIPELPEYSFPIRIRHLLGHTSGLRDQWALLTLAGWRMDDVITTEQILKLVCRQESTNTAPGTYMAYSNTGYTLLAEIIERVSQQSFPDFVESQIFAPRGMTSSLFYADHNKLVSNRAYSYEKQEDAYFKKKLNYSTVGATSMFTTVEDLARWSKFLIAPPTADKDLVQAFNSVSTFEDGSPVIWSASPGDTVYHAKGQLLYYHRGLRVISHGGHDAGFRSICTHFPDQQLSIIILSNDEHIGLFPLMLQFAEYFLAAEFEPEMEPGDSPTVESEEPWNPPVLPWSAEQLTGTYYSRELETSYNLELQEDRLVMSHSRLPDFELKYEGLNIFTGRNTFPFTLKLELTGPLVTGFNITNFGVRDIYFKKQ